VNAADRLAALAAALREAEHAAAVTGTRAARAEVDRARQALHTDPATRQAVRRLGGAQ
jgi:hypothetical protein